MRSAMFDRATSSAVQTALPDAELLVERAKTTRERAYRNASVVEDLVMAQLAQAQKSPKATSKAASALKALSLAAGTLERLYGLKSTALGLDKDTTAGRELPELILRDITQDEIDVIQRGDDNSEMDDELDDDDDENDVVELA